MTLRYDDIPPQLPKETPRVDPDGSASEYQFESEAATNGWFTARAKDLNSRVFTLSDSVDGAYAAITTEQTVRATADSALASSITTLTATVGTNTAAISAETTARTTADTALATSITSLTSTVSGNTAAITAESTARASGDATNATAITSLSTAFGTFNAGGYVKFTSTATPAGADSAYEIKVTASDGVTVVSTGLLFVANADGTGYIKATAGQFIIDGDLIASGALVDLGATQTFPSNIIIQGSSGSTVSTPTLITGTNTASFTVTGNAYVDVIVQSTLQIVSSVGTAYTASLYVGVDGVYRFIKRATSSGSAELVQGDTIRRFRVTAGSHTISLGYTFIPGPIGSPVGDLQLNAGSQYDWAVTKDGRA